MMASCVEEGVQMVLAKGPFGEIFDVCYSIGLICPGVGVGVVGRVDDPHRPILTDLVLVPGVVPSVPGTSSASSSAPGPSTAVSVRRQARRPFRSRSDRLFSLQCRLGAGGVRGTSLSWLQGWSDLPPRASTGLFGGSSENGVVQGMFPPPLPL